MDGLTTRGAAGGATEGLPASYIVGIVLAVVLLVALVTVAVLASTNLRGTPFVPAVFDLTLGAVYLDVIVSSRRLRSVLSISSPVTYFSTTQCATCVFQPYDPKLSGDYSSLQVTDTVTFGLDGKVKGTLGTDTVTLQQNTSSIPCGYTSASLKPATPLILQNYLLLAADAIAEAPMNQVGLSPLKFAASDTPVGKAVHAVLKTRVYESSILEDLRLSGQPVQWSLLLKPFGSRLWLGQEPPTGPDSCPVAGPLQYTPLLPALPDASSPFFSDPGRYYAIGITSMTRLGPDGVPEPITPTSYPGTPIPKIAIITLSQPLVVLPQSPLATKLLATSSTNLQGLRLTFVGGASLTVNPGRSMWSLGGTGLAPIYGQLPDAATKTLSAKNDVIILGCLALQDTFMHFDVQGQRFGVTALQGGPL